MQLEREKEGKREGWEPPVWVLQEVVSASNREPGTSLPAPDRKMLIFLVLHTKIWSVETSEEMDLARGIL